MIDKLSIASIRFKDDGWDGIEQQYMESTLNQRIEMRIRRTCQSDLMQIAVHRKLVWFHYKLESRVEKIGRRFDPPQNRLRI